VLNATKLHVKPSTLLTWTGSIFVQSDSLFSIAAGIRNRFS